MRNFFMFFLAIFVGSILNAQAPPPASDILEVEPIWGYLSIDTNFVSMDTLNPHQNQYSRQGLQDYIVDKDRLYTLEWLWNYGGLPFGEGYLLQCLDKNTGEPIWERHNNYFSGEEYVESSIQSRLRMTESGNLTMNGFRSIDPIELDPGCIFCGAHVNPMKHTIDAEDGSLISEQYESDTTINDSKYLGFEGLGIANDEGMLRYYLRPSVDTVDGFLKNYLFIHHVDQNADETMEPVYTYVHNTFIPNGLLGFSYQNAYQQISENTGAALFGTIDPTVGQRPIVLDLIFLDTSDPMNIFEKNRVDLMPLIVQNQATFAAFLDIRDNNGQLTLTQLVKLQEEMGGTKEYGWISWYDEEGNEITTIDRFQREERDYDRLSQIDYVNGKMYLTGKYNRGSLLDRDTFDLYELEEEGELKLLSRFYGPDASQVDLLGLSILDIEDNGDIIFNFKINYEAGLPARPQASYRVKYSGSDFGITTSTLEVDIASELHVFPNPTTDVISFSENVLQYELYSINGQLIDSRDAKINIGEDIDVGYLNNGLYMIKAVTENGIIKSVTFSKQ